MALTTCPDCGHKLSTSATACPSCGAPMKRPVTIEATGKTWKFVQLIGAGMAIWGTVGCMMTDTTKPGDASAGMALNILLLIGGIAVFVFGRIGAWWFHG